MLNSDLQTQMNPGNQYSELVREKNKIKAKTQISTK